MTVEIKSPTPDLEKDILTFIPVNYRYKRNESYYLEPYNMTLDPFTDRIDIFIKHNYVKIQLHFYNRVQCADVIVHKGGVYMRVILLFVACILLFINIIFTILEGFNYYHANYHLGAHSGRIRGASEPAAVVIDGMRYNVKWIIWEGDYVEE